MLQPPPFTLCTRRTLTAALRLLLPLLLAQLDLQDPQTTRQVVLFPLDRHLKLVQVVRHELLFG